MWVNYTAWNAAAVEYLSERRTPLRIGCEFELEVLLLVELKWMLCADALAGVASNYDESSRSREPRSEPNCMTC